MQAPYDACDTSFDEHARLYGTEPVHWVAVAKITVVAICKVSLEELRKLRIFTRPTAAYGSLPGVVRCSQPVRPEPGRPSRPRSTGEVVCSRAWPGRSRAATSRRPGWSG